MSRIASWTSLSRAGDGALRRFQDEALARFVREELYPFSARYRKVFDAAGVSPRDIRGVADLRRLPFTTKKDLLDAQQGEETRRDFVLVPTPAAIREHWPLARKLAVGLGGARARAVLKRDYTPHFLTFTTGRSSDPVVFAYTPFDVDLLAEAGARILDVLGIPEDGARVLNLFPFAPHLAFWQVAWGGFRTGRLVLPTGGGKVMGSAGSLRMAERFQPTMLVGTPGFIYHLLREAAEKGAALPQVAHVALGAEKVTPGLRRKLRELLAACGARDVSILGTYGFTEARMAFGECPAGPDETTGYHLYPDLGVFEVVHEETLEPLGDGETGELVYTPLAGHGTVVCRYRTGDVAVGGITREPCPRCGRTVPRVSSDLRRSSDRKSASLTKLKGTLVDLPSIGFVLTGLPEVEEWQVVLKKKDDDPHELDELVVRASLRPGADAVAFERRARQQILDSTEVAPNRFEVRSTKEMVDLLGMETEMKEKRFLDLRPK